MSRTSAFLAVLACLLVGCGQSGPLYMPGDPSDITVAPPAAEPDEKDADDPTPSDDS